MPLFRNLLFWLVLALLGALVAQALLQDPGAVLVRFRGMDYRTTVVGALLLVLAALLVLWLLWTALTLPFRGWRAFRQRQARARLTDGLLALQHGHWTRAEKLLTQAAERDDGAAMARIAAAQAADARGDAAAAQAHLDALGERHATTRALAVAERALAQARPADALAALDAPAAQPLPPRGLWLRAQAAAAMGRAHEAYGMLGALRQQQALPATELDAVQARWAAASLREAADPNILADRWDALPKPLQAESAVVGAYATRAAALRWDDAAARSLEQALDARWDDGLVELYGALPIGRLDARREQLERWLQARPANSAVLLALARVLRMQGQWPQAESTLYRALAQGGGGAAWEELGHGYAQVPDDGRASLAYANALRAARGDAPVDMPGRDLRQQIHDAAAVEIRDEHGVPRLRE
jgi:HemY protein